MYYHTQKKIRETKCSFLGLTNFYGANKRFCYAKSELVKPTIFYFKNTNKIVFCPNQTFFRVLFSIMLKICIYVEIKHITEHSKIEEYSDQKSQNAKTI